MRKRLAILAAIAAVAWVSPARSETPNVVVTIKPLHSLVAGVMAGIAEPYLLIQGAGSPHTYQMRPSDARALARAALVFWVGEGLEAFMERPLEALGSGARIVELGEVPGLRLLEVREGGAWETHEDEDEAHSEDKKGGEAKEEHHAHEGHDAHIWLDPLNAVAMVDAIAGALAEVDAARAEAYRGNAAMLTERLRALDEELRTTLAPVRNRPFIVFHDAYQYLETRYRLTAAGSITVSPEVAPGARRIAAIRRKIQESGAACVFHEPQFEPKLARLAVQGSNARLDVLDPEGGPELKPGPGLYFELMRGNAEALRRCLLTPG
jgi:zinc transport system substrate-binding protein